MHPFLNIAKRAAYAAGKIMLRNWERLDAIRINEKQRNDFVTEVDLQAEQEIIRELRKIYPDHAILAEESGISEGRDDYEWIIDPLDGTNNYLHGFPHFAVSIGLRYKGQLEAGLVYDPLKQDMFMATRGQGAVLNDRKIRVRNHTTLQAALIATGIPASELPRHQEAFLAMVNSLLAAGAQTRRTGSAALDLSYVAAGRLDGFWEIGLRPWDMAAGALLVKEAGGMVSDLRGGADFMESGNLICANTKVFKAMLIALRPHLNEKLTH